MSEEQKQQVPILAIVLPHPQDPEKLLIQMNEATPMENRVNFCLACAQTFIGLAAELMERQKSALEESGFVVPRMNLRGPLQ